jgi:hypothetical protein
MFGAHCQPKNMERVKEILQVTNVTTEDKYLGLPIHHGRMNKDKFKSTKERRKDRGRRLEGVE